MKVAEFVSRSDLKQLLDFVLKVVGTAIALAVVGFIIFTWLYFTQKSKDDGLTDWRRRLKKWKKS